MIRDHNTVCSYYFPSPRQFPIDLRIQCTTVFEYSFIIHNSLQLQHVIPRKFAIQMKVFKIKSNLHDVSIVVTRPLDELHNGHQEFSCAKLPLTDKTPRVAHVNIFKMKNYDRDCTPPPGWRGACTWMWVCLPRRPGFEGTFDGCIRIACAYLFLDLTFIGCCWSIETCGTIFLRADLIELRSFAQKISWIFNQGNNGSRWVACYNFLHVLFWKFALQLPPKENWWKSWRRSLNSCYWVSPLALFRW